MAVPYLGMFDSPIQIVIVLIIALVVFGPNRLPEIGRQIGSALRELRKAAGEVSRSLNGEDEPAPNSQSYTDYDYSRSTSYYTPPAPADEPVDLTDYTLVGKSAATVEPKAATPDHSEAAPAEGEGSDEVKDRA